jgi:hypothetical protein
MNSRSSQRIVWMGLYVWSEEVCWFAQKHDRSLVDTFLHQFIVILQMSRNSERTPICLLHYQHILEVFNKTNLNNSIELWCSCLSSSYPILTQESEEVCYRF